MCAFYVPEKHHEELIDKPAQEVPRELDVVRTYFRERCARIRGVPQDGAQGGREGDDGDVLASDSGGFEEVR